MRQKGNGGGKGGKGGKDKGDPSEAIGPAATLAAAHGPGVNVMCVDWSALDENMVVTGGSSLCSGTPCVASGAILQGRGRAGCCSYLTVLRAVGAACVVGSACQHPPPWPAPARRRLGRLHPRVGPAAHGAARGGGDAAAALRPGGQRQRQQREGHHPRGVAPHGQGKGW